MFKQIITLLFFLIGLHSAFALGEHGNQPLTTLVLYTSLHEKPLVTLIESFHAKHPHIQIEVFRCGGSTELESKLASELQAGTPKADLITLTTTYAMERLKQDGWLSPYPEADVRKFDASFYDADKNYFGILRSTTGIIYHTSLPTEDIPTSWYDLIGSKAQGQVVMPSPLYSGAPALHVNVLAHHPDFGWTYFEQLAANQATPVHSNGHVLKWVASGQKLYGIIHDFVALNAKAKGSPVEFVVPKEGATVVTSPIAILRTSSHIAEARLFIDFMLSAEGQTLISTHGCPARNDVPVPTGFPDPKKIKILDAPLIELIAHDKEVKETFSELFK